MKRSIDFLIAEKKWISISALISLLFLLPPLLFALFSGAFGAFGVSEGSLLPYFMGICLSGCMIFSIFSMVSSTFFLYSKRNALSDFWLFIFLIWIIPFMGIAFYVGGARLIGLIKAKDA